MISFGYHGRSLAIMGAHRNHCGHGRKSTRRSERSKMTRKLAHSGWIGCVLALTAGAASAQEPNFGRALALTADELLIGQPVNWYGPGAVYVYRTDASGQWRERARLFAADSARMDDFGRVLATERNTLIVGAPRKRAGIGVAYVFERGNANAPWRQTGIIEPPITGHHRDFAATLALDGDELLIGSPNTDSTGVVYQYRRNKNSWTLHSTIRPAASG